MQPHQPWWRVDFGELFHFRDLLWLLVRRDLLAVYKQTVLGPLWQVLQPLLTSLMFAVIFGLMARMSVQGIPPMLFYLAAVVPWTFFANIINRTSQTLVWNAALMSKVYFPRLVAPIATTLSTMVSFFIQLASFLLIALIYRLSGAYAWTMDATVLMLPVLIILMTVLAFGIGILVAALTTKFRDLGFLLTFGIQLLMYMSPVIFPLSMVPPGSKLRWVIEFNPMTSIIEGFRSVLLGLPMDWGLLLYTTAFAMVSLMAGLAVFQRVQRSFADVI
ncbi:MAG TPA: ABC transporter permease [Flavobacteriales bacterium]|nr:ABC transporter permease [Flavobacteriales bacterium]